MFKDNELSMSNGTSATVSVGTWLKLDAIKLLAIIPIVGQLAVIVIYCIILFGSETAPSVKNRMIATIIWVVLGLVVAGLLLGIFGVAAITAFAQSIGD